MSYYKYEMEDYDNQWIKAPISTVGAKKALRVSNDIPTKRKEALGALRAPQLAVEKMVKEALANPKYKQLQERADSTKSLYAQMLRSMIAKHGSVEAIPDSKLKQRTLYKLKSKNETQHE